MKPTILFKFVVPILGDSQGRLILIVGTGFSEIIWNQNIYLNLLKLHLKLSQVIHTYTNSTQGILSTGDIMPIPSYGKLMMAAG